MITTLFFASNPFFVKFLKDLRSLLYSFWLFHFLYYFYFIYFIARLTFFSFLLVRGESSSSEAYYPEADLHEDIVCCDGSTIYTMKSPMHIICLVLNILIPGSGTIISACSCVHAVKDAESDSKWNFGTVVDGIIQFYTSAILFGWIWSIIFGIALYKKGRDFEVILRSASQK